VRHSNAQSSYATPGNFPKPDQELEKLNGNDLRGLRHEVETGIKNGVVADQDVKTYFRMLDRIEIAIEQRSRREEDLR